MKLEIINIHNKGDADTEFVFLKALEDCDIGEYGIADTTYTDSGDVSNKCRHFYWFPDQKVKKGEYISLRTKIGENTVTKTDKGTSVYKFYWGLKSAVWNDDGDYAVLFLINKWKSHKVKDVT